MTDALHAASDAALVVAVARFREEALAEVYRRHADVAFGAACRILGDPATAGVRVLMLTTFDLDEYVFEALRAGASGFLLKNAPAEDLIRAVRTVAAGDALTAVAQPARAGDAVPGRNTRDAHRRAALR